MKRVWLITLLELLLISIQDVLLWARIFEADELWEYIGVYHEGWVVTVWALVLVGFLWTGPDWRMGVFHGVLLATLYYCGLPDVLYYALQMKPLPDALPWLDEHPLILFSPVTDQNLMLNVALWLGAWLGISGLIVRDAQRMDSGFRFEP